MVVVESLKNINMKKKSLNLLKGISISNLFYLCSYIECIFYIKLGSFCILIFKPIFNNKI